MEMSKFRAALFSSENIDKMNEVNSKIVYNLKRLLGNDTLTQSQCIKFGNIFESSLNAALIDSESGLTLLEIKLVTPSEKGKKIQIDLIFELKNQLYYFELKTNLNLDSEKSKATNKKIDKLTKHFNLDLSKYDKIHTNILNCWWKKEKGMNITTNKNVYFMSDFFELISCKTNEDEYYQMMKDFGKLVNVAE